MIVVLFIWLYYYWNCWYWLKWNRYLVYDWLYFFGYVVVGGWLDLVYEMWNYGDFW